MTGFYGLTETTPTQAGAESDQLPAVMDYAKIAAIVSLAEHRRSQASGSMLRRLIATWASLIRRPGRAVPDNIRQPKLHA